MSIIETSKSQGQVSIKWTPPYDLNENGSTNDYHYDLLRKLNKKNSLYEVISLKKKDTSFVDRNLNTEQLQYQYRVICYDSKLALLDTSASASTLWLESIARYKGVAVEWSADVPWSLKSPYHFIYRNRVEEVEPTKFVLIDSVNVSISDFKYADFGAFNNQPLNPSLEYCYFVSTSGSYHNQLLPEPLINRSQTVCKKPSNIVPNCSGSMIHELDSCKPLISRIEEFRTNLYPNPATDLFYISNAEGSDLRVTMMNLNGNLIPVPSDWQEGVNISHLKSGIYLIVITNKRNDQVIMKKLIVK